MLAFRQLFDYMNENLKFWLYELIVTLSISSVLIGLGIYFI